MDRTSGTPVPPESFSFSGDPETPLGAVFTPANWARFAVECAGLVDAWLAGATVLDPTMGQGNLLDALVDLALQRGYSPEELPFDRLFGVELVPEYHLAALHGFRRRYGVAMERQFHCGDLFTSDLPPCDRVLGNPPWINYADLPEALKPLYRSRFLDSGLVPDRRTLLWGGSRVDVAALVVQWVLSRHLTVGGQAWFFLPLSLLLNQGAHSGFRRYIAGSRPFALKQVYDFGPGVFPDVSTRHGLVHFQADEENRFPVGYEQWDGREWTSGSASPAFTSDGPLCVHRGGGNPPWSGWTPLSVEARSRPRQGLNTGGANHVYFFSCWEDAGDGLCRVDGILLPQVWVHPVLPSGSFSDPDATPQRWVVIPHHPSGRPLTAEELSLVPLLEAYLSRHRTTLEQRRGALLGSWRQRGAWWALLGVGPYSFAPYKVFWQAYGKAEFLPVVRSGRWQANQSLQAFIPCWSEAEAQRIALGLSHPAVAAFLRSTNTQGTKSWAQPGRIRTLLHES